MARTLLAAGLGFAGVACLLLLLAPRPAAAQEVKEGDVIVQFDDSAQAVRTFTFTQPISGLEALYLTGLEVVTASTSFGPAVCSIEGVGCPADDCFCNPTQFWAYSFWDGSAWQSYAVGAGSSLITQTGAVEGWRWGPFGAAQAPAPGALAAASGLDWLQARQVLTDGSYGGAGATVETMLSVGANGQKASEWRRAAGAPSLADAALGSLAAYARGGAAAAGKSSVALAASSACVPPLMAGPSQFYSATLGVYSSQSGPNAWAMLGTLALREALPMEAAEGLRGQALSNGGWEWAPGWGADTNSTALALQALVAAGEAPTGTVVAAGLAYLKDAQNTDGGFAYALESGTPGPSDANSTAYVVQALAAVGEDPRGAAWQVGGVGPIDYLLSVRETDGGFAWKKGTGSNQLATQQVIPALLGRAYPPADDAGAPQACAGVFLPDIQR